MRSLVRVLFCVAVASSADALPIPAQIVPVRSVPVASGDQFLLLPSESLGMGGVRVAVHDSLADPWSNPAKGTFVRESAFLSSPTFYSISRDGGAGRTLPLAGVFAGSRWFGGAVGALQQIDNDPVRVPVWTQLLIDDRNPPRRLSDTFERNLYGAAFAGVRLGTGWSVGVSLAASDLSAMDGVDLLYSGADRIEQRGSTQDVRLGVRRSGVRDEISILLLHARVSMTHDVIYEGWAWDPDRMTSVYESRLEKNEDVSRTWGAQLEWTRALSAPGWRIGASATVNRKSHPKIPNYEIQNIPRDPGLTWAYEAAFGIARRIDDTTVGVDVAFQPIWSETWQEANATDVAGSNGSLSVGDRSIENDFFFTNVFLRAGVSHVIDRATLQAGLEARSYDYALEQVDHVQQEYRDQDESWMEWTPAFGLAIRFSVLEVRYSARHTSGTGRPGADLVPAWPTSTQTVISQTEADFILAPEGPLTLQEASVFTHQLSVRVPIR